MYYPVEEVIQLEQLVALYKRLAYYSNEINKTLNNDKIVNYRKEIRETISLIELIEPLFYNVNATDDKVKEDYAKLDKIRLKVEDTITYLENQQFLFESYCDNYHNEDDYIYHFYAGEVYCIQNIVLPKLYKLIDN